MSSRQRRILFYCIGLSVLLSWGFVLYTHADKELWKAEVRLLNEKLSSYEARLDFMKGRIRLLRLEGENWEMRFSGEFDGPFEIWIPEYFPSNSEAHRFSKSRFVEFYNLYMRAMHTAPEAMGVKSRGEKATSKEQGSPTMRSTEQP